MVTIQPTYTPTYSPMAAYSLECLPTYGGVTTRWPTHVWQFGHSLASLSTQQPVHLPTHLLTYYCAGLPDPVSIHQFTELSTCVPAGLSTHPLTPTVYPPVVIPTNHHTYSPPYPSSDLPVHGSLPICWLFRSSAYPLTTLSTPGLLTHQTIHH